MRRGAGDHHGGGDPRAALADGRDLAAHAALIALAAVAYLAIRYGAAPRWGGFWREHASDLLAGATLPAVTAVIAAPGTPAGRWVRSTAGRLAVVAFAAFAWEVVAPRIVPGSVGDPLDALSYLAGTLAYVALSKTRIAAAVRRDPRSILQEATP